MQCDNSSVPSLAIVTFVSLNKRTERLTRVVKSQKECISFHFGANPSISVVANQADRLPGCFIHPSWQFGISSLSASQKMGTAGKLQAINEQEEWHIGLRSLVDHNNMNCFRFLSSSIVYWNWFHCDLNIWRQSWYSLELRLGCTVTCRGLGMLRNFSFRPSLQEKSWPLNFHVRFCSRLSVALLKIFRRHWTPADDTAL